ncbi:MAG: hypothetical protein PHX82_08680 [Paracoccaceae bacterium]|nr:hypothetical protein [Paracoccaceae bacterium]
MMDRTEIEALLPFYANGTLSGDERDAVAAALAADPALELELAALRAMRQTLQSEAPRSPGEFGLARLMRDVDQPAQMATVPAAPHRTRLWQIAAAVAVAAFLGQNLWLAMPRTDGYDLAGEARATITVAFQPGATEADIRALLLGLDLTIVGGPSALGLYELAATGRAVGDADLAALNASPLVETASHAGE